MPLEDNTNKLLYVPFNSDYVVSDQIKKLLTEDAFFNECYLYCKYEKYLETSNAGEEESGSSIDVGNYYAYIDEQDSAYKAFKRWLDSYESAIYCVKDDAGSGKTTYLHYLKYSRKENNEVWCIIDIQNSS